MYLLYEIVKKVMYYLYTFRVYQQDTKFRRHHPGLKVTSPLGLSLPTSGNLDSVSHILPTYSKNRLSQRCGG